MTSEEILIELVIRKFIALYNQKYCKDSPYKEERNILGDGYCFYFACFLQSIFPDGEVLGSPVDHYIFKYHDAYYDYRGKIPSFGGFLDITPDTCLLVTDLYPVPKEHFLEVLQLMDPYKRMTWQGFLPTLFKYATRRQEQLVRKKKKSL